MKVIKNAGVQAANGYYTPNTCITGKENGEKYLIMVFTHSDGFSIFYERRVSGEADVWEYEETENGESTAWGTHGLLPYIPQWVAAHVNKIVEKAGVAYRMKGE
nr:MAG TPA: hypothetical protein [Caudoviricetes sp.]